MNSNRLERTPDRDYPAIELDMTDFLEHLSEEYMCAKVDVRDAQKNLETIEFETEDCTHLGDVSSVSANGLEREEKVRKFKMGSLHFILM